MKSSGVFPAARKVLKDARHRLCSLFDVRRHISAHVFVSIFLSVLLISTFLISAYSLNAMNDLTQVSVLSGQSAVDTIASQIDTFVDNIAQTHVLLFSSENVYPFLYDTSVSMPSYEWFQGYHDAQNMLRFCGRSQYNLISGMLLQKSASEKLQYGGFNALIDPYSLKPDELNRLLLRDGFAFYVSSTSLGDGSNAYLYSQIYNSAFDSLCRGLLMPDSGLVLLDAEGSVFRRYEDGADAAGQIDAYLAGARRASCPADCIVRRARRRRPALPSRWSSPQCAFQKSCPKSSPGCCRGAFRARRPGSCSASGFPVRW